MTPERNISVARLTIGAYFQLWTGTTARPDSRARLRAFSSSTKSNSNGFSQRTFHPFASASSIGSPCNAGGVQISTKSISAPAASSSIVANVATPGSDSRAAWRRSSVRSTTATIFASRQCAYAGQCPCRATSPKPIIAPLSTLLFRFETLQYLGNNGQRGIRLFSRKNQRRMDANSRCVSHHNQAVGETALEELDALLLR